MSEIIKFRKIYGTYDSRGERSEILERQEIMSRCSLTKENVLSILNQESSIPEENIVVGSVMVFLFDLQNNMFVIKRNPHKPENPGLWDKSVGGHVIEDQTYDQTAIKETGEELGVEVMIARDEEDFLAVLSKGGIDKKAVLIKIDELKNYISKRTTGIEGDYWYKLFDVGLYIGFYTGDVRFADGESVEKRMTPVSQLEKEVQVRPDVFTEDIICLFQRYHLSARVANISSRVHKLMETQKPQE